MFKVGQKVICINGTYHLDKRSLYDIIFYGWEFPKKGSVYTVRRVTESGILVEELVNKVIREINKEPEFYFWRFAPLNEILDEYELEKYMNSRTEIINSLYN